MSKLDIKPDDLQLVKRILQQHAPDLEVWAYGSRVKGQSHDASDLDLVLRNPKNLEKPAAGLARLKQVFTDSNLPFLIDVMDWANLPPDYQREIMKQHVSIKTDNM